MNSKVYTRDGNVVVIYYHEIIKEYKITVFSIDYTRCHWVRADSCDDALEKGYDKNHRGYISIPFESSFEMCVGRGLDLIDPSLPDWFMENIMMEKLKE